MSPLKSKLQKIKYLDSLGPAQILDPARALKQRSIVVLACFELGAKLPFLPEGPADKTVVIQNFGNSVGHGYKLHSGVWASLELALAQNISTDVIVYGHSPCRAINCLVNPAEWSLPELENAICFDEWREANSVLFGLLDSKYKDLPLSDQIAEIGKENVLLQLCFLAQSSIISDRLASGAVVLHGWYYSKETGQLLTYSNRFSGFVESDCRQ